MSDSLTKFIFGRLSWESLPLHEPIVVATFAVVALGGVALLAALTYFRLWGYLWREWFTSVDHKKIGIMYMVLGLVMFLRGFADAAMMRLQQSMAFGENMGYLPPHHYDQIFTAHGVIMIFFVAMPLVTGLMNYVVPLQIGARDVAFPFLNNFSFWMTVGGVGPVCILQARRALEEGLAFVLALPCGPGGRRERLSRFDMVAGAPQLPAPVHLLPVLAGRIGRRDCSGPAFPARSTGSCKACTSLPVVFLDARVRFSFS